MEIIRRVPVGIPRNVHVACRPSRRPRRWDRIEGLSSAALVLGLETGDQVAFLVVLFAYSTLAAVALPIPVEPILLLQPEISPAIKAITLGLGKGVGAIAVFFIGHKVNPWLVRWVDRRRIGRRIFYALEGFVRKTGVVGLLILLSIPFMSDTAVNYFYSVLNEEGRAISRSPFVIANVIGGIVRALIFLWLVSA